MPLTDLLRTVQLVVVTGKGGVGKTALSATVGRLLAEAGRRTLVLEVDPRENVHQMLGVPPSGGEIVAAGPRLWAQNLKPERVFDELVRERLKLEMLVRRVLDSAVYEQFAAGAPGLKELAILGHALRLLRGESVVGSPPLDAIVLDAPATGHGIRLLTAPQLVSGAIRTGPFADLAGQVAGFVADRERCGVLVVTQAEEMPVEESLELRAALARELSRPPLALIVNGLYPPVSALGAGGVEDGRRSLWRRRRELNERELARLAADWPEPRFLVPQLPVSRGPELVAALGRCLTAAEATA